MPRRTLLSLACLFFLSAPVTGADDKPAAKRSPRRFYGLASDPAGKRLFASGAEYEVVHQFQFADGYLSDHRELAVGKPEESYVPAGIACNRAGTKLYVACAWGHTLCALPPADVEKRRHLPLGKDSYPYAVLPSADGKRLFVSLWGG